MESLNIINCTTDTIEIVKSSSINTISIPSGEDRLIQVGTIKTSVSGHFHRGSFIVFKKCRQYTFITFGQALLHKRLQNGIMTILVYE